MSPADLATLVVALGLGLGAWAFARRFGGGAALGELERANRVLERRVNELTSENKRQAERIAELSARTDIAIALAPVLHALQEHELRAEKRAAATLAVLDLIAQRLGPDAAVAA